MASFNHISGQEPSTVTFKAATVTMTRNSSEMHQELISLADPESSLSIARVSSAAPASTDAGLIVRQVGFDSNVTIRGNSTVVVSAFAAGYVSSAAPAANSSGLIVWPVGYSTIVSVAALPANSSQVEVRNTVAISGNSTAFIPAGQLSSAVAPANSSIAQVVRIASGPSSAADFVSNVSSVAGIVAVRPSDTNWASSAGFHFDSSGALHITGSFTASTTVTVNGNQSSNSSVYLPVRLTNGTSFLAAASDYVDDSTASNIAGPTIMFDNGTNATMRHVSLTAGLPVNIVSGAASGPTSTAAPATNDTGLVVRQVGYSTIVSVANTVTIQGNSTGFIPAAQLSSAVAPSNSSIAQVVRIASGPSSAADFVSNVSSVAGIVAVRPSDTNWASSAGFHFDSSGALTVAASFTGSTTVNVSSVSGRVGVAPTDTNWASSAGFHFDSSGALQVAASFTGSTIVSVAALPAGMVSSAAPAANDTGLFVRVIGHSTIVSVANTVTIAGNSTVLIGAGQLSSATVASNSSIAQVVRIAGGVSSAADFPVRPVFSSTGADNPVSVSALPANSSIVAIGSIAAGLISSGAPAHGSSALMVRQVVSSLQSTTVTILSSNSTALYTLLSSAAGRTRVYGYFAGAGANASPSTVLIGDSTTPGRYAIVMSSGTFGANLAVSPPGFLFEAGAGNAIQVRIESASTAISVRFGLSYFID